MYVQNSPFLKKSKVKGGGTKKVCLPAAKVKSMSKAEKDKVIRAKEEEKPRPRVTNYIGECFLKIATHLSYKPNFVNYMFREDMICDGIENCLQYIDNFNPEKSQNPFAYFTQIIYYAFLRRIQKEKKQLEIKGKILERSGYDEVMHTDTYDGTMSGMNASYSDMGSIKENIETRMNR